MKKICENCHAHNEAEAKTCVSCGMTFADPQKIRTKKIVKWSILGAIGAFLVLYFGLCVIGANMTKPSNTITDYFSLVADGKYEEALARFDVPEAGAEFNTPDAFAQWCKDTYGEGEDVKVVSITRAKVKDEAEDARSYTVELAGGYSAVYSIHKEGRSMLLYDGWRMDTPKGLFDSVYTVYAPEGVEVTVNGVAVGDEYKIGAKEVPGYGGLDDTSLVPTLQAYEIPGLLGAPEVSGTLNGVACVKLEEDGAVLFSQPISDELRAEYEDLTLDVSTAYATFISDDARFGAIAYYLINQSDIYRNLSTFYNGWYTYHTGHYMEDIEFYDMCIYSDEAFTCSIDFTYHVTGIPAAQSHQTFPTTYKIYFVKHNGQWQAADIQSINRVDE